MTKKIVMYETRWYFTLQDGREGEGYETEAEAKAALKKLDPSIRRAYHITSFTTQVTE